MRLQNWESLLERISDAVLELDAEGRITSVNRACAGMLGYAPAEMAGKHFAELRHDFAGQSRPSPEIVASFGLYFLDKAELEELPMIMRHSSGRAVQVHLRSVMDRSEDGGFAGALCVLLPGDSARDRTPAPENRETLTRRLWETEENYRGILENSGDAVIIADFNGRVVTVNPALLQLLGYETADGVTGRLVVELGPRGGSFTCTTGETIEIDVRMQDEQLRVANQLFERGRASAELYLNRADGIAIPVEATMSLLRDPSGVRRGSIIICRDCTARRLIERELRTARDELEQKVVERTRSLEEVNTALRVLLKAREEDREELEKKIISVIQRFVTPYLDKLRSTHLSPQQKAFLEIVETNLANALAPYLNRFAALCMQLTPAELQIAQLVKEGKSTKDIAAILSISSQTVETYRKRIRGKLGLQNSKTNLRSYFAGLV